MNVSIIAIGDELLIGQVTDTNTTEIANMITPVGWNVRNVRVVRDNASDIRQAIDDALADSDVVLTTGGLGPTKDDITKQVLCDYFGGTLRTDPSVLENIKEVFKRRHLQLNDLTAAQAAVPTSCHVIQNTVGTAPVMWFDRRGKVLVSMPGVPFEMRHAMRNGVLPRLLEHYGHRDVIEHRVLLVTGITESDTARALARIENSLPDYLHLAYLPQPGLLRLRLDGVHTNRDFICGEIDRYADAIAGVLGDHVLWRRDDTPAEIVITLLRRRGLHLATAESCTGGNIAHRITAVAGCSDVYNGSVVSYTNTAKVSLLGVSTATLDSHGAVSREVAAEMARGAIRALGTECAISTTGIAGPSGGTPDKPVGTVCIAVKGPDFEVSARHHFPGSRDRIIDRASTTALLSLARELLDHA